MVNVDNLIKYLNRRRKDYIRMCNLDEDRVISEMRSGRAYLKHRLRIHLGEKKFSKLGEKTLELFKEKEKGLVVVT